MMTLLKRLLLMVQFLTTLPIPVKLDVTEKDFGKGLVFAPLIGLLIGGILTGAYHVLIAVFPPLAVAVFIVIIYILLTGGLHLDGLGDTFDGVFSNRSKDRMLEIMRDSRVGTNAVLVVVCVIMLYVVLLSSFEKEYMIRVLLLMPVAGRIGSLTGACASSYARTGDGLGKSFIDYCGFWEILHGFFLYCILFHAVLGIPGLALCAAAFVSAFLWVKFLGRKIGGATGDVLGAVCELNQVTFLVLFYLMMRI